jgi:hypothetical protein
MKICQLCDNQIVEDVYILRIWSNKGNEYKEVAGHEKCVDKKINELQKEKVERSP